VIQAADRHSLTLKLPARKPDRYVSVVVLELDGRPDVDRTPVEQGGGVISLPAWMADLHVNTGTMGPDRAGIMSNWRNKRNWISWDLRVGRPGRYRIVVRTLARKSAGWKGGHRVEASIAGQSVIATLRADEPVERPRARYFPEAGSRLGEVTIKRPGRHTLKLRAVRINKSVDTGLSVSEVRLVLVR